MPRQAAAARPFTVNGSTREHLKPPDDLDQIERAVFADLIAGSPPSHFLPSDSALLACLAKNIVLERVAFGELRASGYVVSGANGDRPSAWLEVLKTATRSVTTLSRMLSLSPGGRLPSSKPSEEAPLSFYQREKMMRGDHDPN